MKIVTWNLWNKNPNQFASVKFLVNLGAEVICLQEVLLETVFEIQRFCQKEKNPKITDSNQNFNQNSKEIENEKNPNKKFQNYDQDSRAKLTLVLETRNQTYLEKNLQKIKQNLENKNLEKSKFAKTNYKEKKASENCVPNPETSQTSDSSYKAATADTDQKNPDSQNFKWQMFHALDHRDAKAQHYLVILTRIPVCRHFCDYLDSAPPKSFLAKRHQIQSVRQFHYVDLVCQKTKFRIFNIHLEVAVGPKKRLAQFDNLVKNFGVNNLICGDFNIFPHPIGSFFVGWAASFTLSDYATNERKKFEEKFQKLSLNNIFVKKITYPKYKLQLDHILVPQNFTILEKKLEKKLSNSDHLWLFCDIYTNF